MALALFSWLACTVLGLVLIDLDLGPSLVSLTMGHGVTVTDAAGAAALVAGWVGPVIIARGRLRTYRVPPARRLVSGVAVIGSGASLVVVSLFVPDFTGRNFAMGGLVLILQCAAAITVLAGHRR